MHETNCSSETPLPVEYIDSNTRLAYAVYQLSGDTDEDRFSVFLSDEDSNDTTMSHFGLFDGHGGAYAAEELAEFFHNDVMRRYNAVKRQSKANFDKEDVDSTFCEVFRVAVADIDNKIRSQSTSGSTLVSLFALNFPDGSTRVFCPWVGDSRCAMFHIQNNKVCVSEMSMDHKPTLHREKKRIEKKENILWTGEPIEVNYELNGQTLDDKTVHSISSSTSGKRKVFAIMELPGQSQDPESDDGDYKADEESDVPTKPANMCVHDAIHDLRKCSTTKDETKTDYITLPPRPAMTNNFSDVNVLETFIGRRSLPGSPMVGPYAVFGRYGTSLTMTRSIGDKYGPRSCVAVPDISATTIPAGKHVRFIIGSDGLWDTISMETAQDVALLVRSPRVAASKLVALARAVRASSEMHMDDITCIIVDVNPGNFEYPPDNAVKCNCTIS